MVISIDNKNTVVGKKIKIKKSIKTIRENMYIILVFFFAVVVGLNLALYNLLFDEVNLKDSNIINRLNANSIIIGIVIGFLIAILTIKFHENIKSKNKNIEMCKNYAWIFRADLERCERVFKNKRFELIKISSVTIVKNWLQAFSHISSQLDIEEIKQLVNYYSKMDKLVEYEKRINYHLEAMQYSSLKDYPHMKEYKELIAMFTFEMKSLFKVNVSLLVKKLEIMCK